LRKVVLALSLALKGIGEIAFFSFLDLLQEALALLSEFGLETQVMLNVVDQSIEAGRLGFRLGAKLFQSKAEVLNVGLDVGVPKLGLILELAEFRSLADELGLVAQPGEHGLGGQRCDDQGLPQHVPFVVDAVEGGFGGVESIVKRCQVLFTRADVVEEGGVLLHTVGFESKAVCHVIGLAYVSFIVGK
jgi:hypothetical protein